MSVERGTERPSFEDGRSDAQEGTTVRGAETSAADTANPADTAPATSPAWSGPMEWAEADLMPPLMPEERPTQSAAEQAVEAALPLGARFAQAAVASTVYVTGEAPRDIGFDSIGGTAAAGQGLLWIGLREPDADLMRAVGAQLGLADAVIDEVIEPHRRPKIIEYEQCTLVVAITAEMQRERLVFGDTQVLIGKGWLLTVRRGSRGTHQALRALLASSPEFMGRGSAYVASALLDLLVDRYVEVLQYFEGKVTGFEHQFLLRGFRQIDVHRLYRCRRSLLSMQTVVAPMVEICRRLAHVDLRGVDPGSRGYFREVADRVQRVIESIGSLRETLAFAFEASMMLDQMQQTDITRRLAAWAAILAVPTAVAGIYGMNFEFMPELHWRYGYPTMLGGTFTVCSLLYWRFRRIKWL